MRELIMDILTILMLIVILVGGLTLTLISGVVAFIVLLPVVTLYYTMKTIEDIWDLIS
jgi:hypothetical protein